VQSAKDELNWSNNKSRDYFFVLVASNFVFY